MILGAAGLAWLFAHAATGQTFFPYEADAHTLILAHFDETSGSSATNAGSLGREFFSVNMATASATPPVVTDVLGATGHTGFGSAADFASGQLLGWDGNNSGAYDGDAGGATLSADAVSLASLGIGNGGQTPFTIEALIRPSVINANQEIVSTDSSAVSRGFQFRINDSGELEFHAIAAGVQIVAGIPTVGPNAFVADSWYHVAVTYDGTTVRLYWTHLGAAQTGVNLIGEGSAAIGAAQGLVEGPLCIGNENRNVGGEYFRGSIDEVRISDVARSAGDFYWLPSDPQTAPRVAFLRDSVVTDNALLMPTSAPYGRAINGVSFQDQILLTFDGYQYTGWYDTIDTTQTVWLARRSIDDAMVGDWEVFNTGSEFLNGDEPGWDAHNVISLGISPVDGTLHMAWDHHNHTLRYRVSVAGLCTTNKTAWGTPGMLKAEQNWLVAPGQTITDVTYPLFINSPDNTLFFQCRTGITNNGDQMLQVYNPATGSWNPRWKVAAKEGSYTGLLFTGSGTSTRRNDYPNGFDFGSDGTLHHTWTYREQADSANHDLHYAYSDDGGVTWRNNAGTVIADTNAGQAIRVDSEGIVFKTLDSRQLLINQQAQCVDNDGRVHVLALHRREEPEFGFQPGDSRFSVVDTAYYHYFRDPMTHVWSQRLLPPDDYPVGSRPKIAFDSRGNVYAAYVSYASKTENVVPGYGSGKLVISSASRGSNYTDWTVAQVIDAEFTGEPLIDQARLLTDNVLSVFIQEDSPTTGVVGSRLHVYDFAADVPRPSPLSLALIGDDSVVSLDATSGATYQLQTTINPVSIPWADLGGEVQGRDGLLGIIHPDGALDSERFYRIRQIPAVLYLERPAFFPEADSVSGSSGLDEIRSAIAPR